MTHERLQLIASRFARTQARVRGGFVLRKGTGMFHCTMRQDHAGDAGG